MATFLSTTTINDLPDVILSIIISDVSNVRSRNAASLVCRKWRSIERSSRTSLTLRGNIANSFLLPNCFRSVTHLDLSLLSPWGYPLFSPTTPPSTADLIASFLLKAFPLVCSLTIYARNLTVLQPLTTQWPSLVQVKLLRWHQRPQLASGEELQTLLIRNQSLTHLDLSAFYCWTDDVPAALGSFPVVCSNLRSLNLLNPSFSEGFKSEEITEITKFCPNLKEFLAVCMFDPRYVGCVGDECLVSVAANCPRLSKLHLVDTAALSNSRADPEFSGFTLDDSKISVAGLVEVFSGLTFLEELVLDVCNNIMDSGPAIEILKTRCVNLKSLKLGQFHGISMPVESKLDGVALCQGLKSLSIRNVGDLTDMGLIAIGRGCSRLEKFEVEGCKRITMKGMRTLASLLRKTLVDVRISCCKHLNVGMSLKSLEPVQNRIEMLAIDCVWDSVAELDDDPEGIQYDFDLNKLDQGGASNQPERFGDFFDNTCDGDTMFSKNKRCRYSYDHNNSSMGLPNSQTWNQLRSLSLWIGVGELLTPLADAGFEDCPNLEEIRIKVEGDCREWSKPPQLPFGLSTLARYPKLVKMHLDCGETIGYAHTAPSGQMDLSQWERFYLLGIGALKLNEFDYWPPQDRDVNQRCISLPVAGLLQQCLSLRKLIIHGTAHEHFIQFFLKIPNLRDFQLREDYYPAPENDMSTEMRVDSLCRFEAALNSRRIPD